VETTRKEVHMKRNTLLRLAALSCAAVASLAAATPTPAAQHNYTVTPLVSNGYLAGTIVDPNLVNAWGLTATASSPWWVADNGTGKSTLYNGNTGAPQALVVSVDRSPTGAVFNGTTGFTVPGTAARAVFIFDTEAGQLLAWSPAFGTTAQVAHTQAGAIYKGLAIATTGAGAPRLYAANFHAATVDVYDGSFNLVTEPGAFVDPSLPDGYAPFGIQNVGGRIFVSYAKQDADAEDEIAGQGRGFVDEYDTNGHLLQRVAQHGQLNAPWGIALAPASFGEFGGDLLVGNFGDGQINAYEPQPDGSFERVGGLRDDSGRQIAIDGLWALQFGNGGTAGPKEKLFFTAGPNDEEDGLFGSITAG
jgi:uncharacterized protein (TIGR03118 family)